MTVSANTKVFHVTSTQTRVASADYSFSVPLTNFGAASDFDVFFYITDTDGLVTSGQLSTSSVPALSGFQISGGQVTFTITESASITGDALLQEVFFLVAPKSTEGQSYDPGLSNAPEVLENSIDDMFRRLLALERRMELVPEVTRDLDNTNSLSEDFPSKGGRKRPLIPDGGALLAVSADGNFVLESLGGEHLDDGIIDTAHIGPEAVTTAKLDDSAVTTPKLADGAVTADKLGNSAVTTAKINDDAVTEDKIADATVAKINGALQRSGGTMTGKITLDGAPTSDLHAATKKYVDDNAGSGNGGGGLTTVNVDTAHLTGDGSSESPISIAAGGIGSDELAPESVTHTQLGEDAVQALNIQNNAIEEEHISVEAVSREKIADNAVNSAKLASLAVATGNIQNGAVTGAKIGVGAVISVHIGDGEVETTNLDDLAVTGAKVAANAVSTTKIGNGAVTEEKLATAVTSKINGALQRSGGTMTGKITLDGDPTSDLHAATKQYVDDNAGGGSSTTPTFEEFPPAVDLDDFDSSTNEIEKPWSVYFYPSGDTTVQALATATGDGTESGRTYFDLAAGESIAFGMLLSRTQRQHINENFGTTPEDFHLNHSESAPNGSTSVERKIIDLDKTTVVSESATGNVTATALPVNLSTIRTLNARINEIFSGYLYLSIENTGTETLRVTAEDTNGDVFTPSIGNRSQREIEYAQLPEGTIWSEGENLKIKTAEQTYANRNNDSDLVPDGAINTDQIADEAITNAKIDDFTINAVKLGTSSVTEAKIDDGAVTTDKIADSAVTPAKLSFGDASTTAKGIVELATSEETKTGLSTTLASPPRGVSDAIADRVIIGEEVFHGNLRENPQGDSQPLSGTYTSHTLSHPKGGSEFEISHALQIYHQVEGLPLVLTIKGEAYKEGASITTPSWADHSMTLIV